MANQNGNKQGSGQAAGGSQSGSGQPGGADGHQQKAQDQGDNAGMHGYGGQHSGGMGGERGGDLYDAGTGQSGMTGRSGMGGNENNHAHANLPLGQQTHDADADQYAGPLDEEEPAEVQQSVQREGMGRHRGRRHEQALDAAADIDKLGQESGAARSNDDAAPR